MGALAIETLVSGELACEAFDLLSDSDLQINLCRTCRNIFHRLNKYNSFLNKYRKGVLSIETLVQVLHSQEALTCSYLISISRYISVRLSGDTKGTTRVEAQILMCPADESVKTLFVNYEMFSFHWLCHLALVPSMQSFSLNCCTPQILITIVVFFFKFQ